MNFELNTLGQPVGDRLPFWTPPPLPPRVVLTGRYCRLEPLEVGHAAALDAASRLDGDGRSWTYLPYGPFETPAAHLAWVEHAAASTDPLFYAVACEPDGEALGTASFLRMAPQHGVLEIGHLHFSPRLQRTRAATEAVFLLLEQAFQLGYRRCEWKCDALNAPSRAAAGRLGFTFEGIFRQAVIVKGRNRDTAWFAMLDRDWPRLEPAFRRWLAPDNFSLGGTQKTRLEASGNRQESAAAANAS